MRLAILGLLLVACGQTVPWHYQPLRTPNGNAGYAIECRWQTDCWYWAGRLCPYGYEALDSGTQKTTNDVKATAIKSPMVSTVVVDQGENFHSLLIECREPKTTAPAKAPGEKTPIAEPGF